MRAVRGDAETGASGGAASSAHTRVPHGVAGRHAGVAPADRSASGPFAPTPSTSGDIHARNPGVAVTGTEKTLLDVTPNVTTLPGGRRASARRSSRGRWELPPRRILLAAGGGLVALALIIWVVVVNLGGSSGKHSPSAASGPRTQSTVLVQLEDTLGHAAVASALIAHDPTDHEGAIVLVPSGVISQVPGFGAMPFGKASTLGQADAPRITLADLMGVNIDGSWTLSAKALASLVDKVGGVDVKVDVDVTKPGPKGSTTIVVPAGNHHVTGATAVAYATFLGASEPEQARLARFDAVLRGVLGKLPKQPGAVAPLVTGLGSGSLSSLPATRLADLLVGLASDDAKNAMVDSVLPVTRIDAGNDLQAFSLDAAKTTAFVKAHLAQSVPPNQKVTGNRVMVENQVGTPGIGETTRSRLMKAGFTYVPGANAPGMPNPTAPSVVLITGKTAADIAKGDAVAAALGLPASDVRVSTQHVRVADVIVLLGADYKP